MTVHLDIPQDLYDRAERIARAQRISVGDVLAAACAEHVSSWERLQARAARGDRAAFLGVLAKAPDIEPAEPDRLP